MISNVTVILAIFLLFSGITVAQQTGGITNSDNIPSHMPKPPESGSLMDHPEYRKAMDEWVAKYPEEFERAVKADPTLNIFAPPVSREPKPGDRSLTGPLPYSFPPFMKYPVNETKPVFIDNHNPDYDSLVYKRKLQHWYYLYDQAGYIDNYGPIPDIPDSIKGITHPNQFSPEVDTGQYLRYYPEFE